MVSQLYEKCIILNMVALSLYACYLSVQLVQLNDDGRVEKEKREKGQQGGEKRVQSDAVDVIIERIFPELSLLHMNLIHGLCNVDDESFVVT